jgi:YesN/AraC family two-component response regulator
MIMPEMNGAQTFQVLKKINPKVRVVICSGYSLNDEVDKLIKAGALSFIQKPFLKSTLAQMLSLISKTINPSVRSA